MIFELVMVVIVSDCDMLFWVDKLCGSKNIFKREILNLKNKNSIELKNQSDNKFHNLSPSIRKIHTNLIFNAI